MDPTSSPHYLIQYNDGTTKSGPVADMTSLIPKPPVDASYSTHLLPTFLRLNSKLIKLDGQYHKVCLMQSPKGIYYFSYK